MKNVINLLNRLYKYQTFVVILGSLHVGSADAGSLGKETNSILCQNVTQHLQAGDVIFISSNSEVFKNVAKSTLSWTSHVGVALPDSNNRLVIYESTLPLSKKTAICDFVKRTANDEIAIMRPRADLTQQNIKRLQNVAQGLMGRVYHTGFDYDTKTRLYCSKFVYDVFMKALGIEIGFIETFADLIRKNPDPELIDFWNRWFFGALPEDRRVVTPAGQLNDKDLLPVFSTVDLQFP